MKPLVDMTNTADGPPPSPVTKEDQDQSFLDGPTRDKAGRRAGTTSGASSPALVPLSPAPYLLCVRPCQIFRSTARSTLINGDAVGAALLKDIEPQEGDRAAQDVEDGHA